MRSVCWVWLQSWISLCVKTVTTLDKIPANLQCAQCQYNRKIKVLLLELKHHIHVRPLIT